jgi:hypothetical protein
MFKKPGFHREVNRVIDAGRYAAETPARVYDGVIYALIGRISHKERQKAADKAAIDIDTILDKLGDSIRKATVHLDRPRTFESFCVDNGLDINEIIDYVTLDLDQALREEYKRIKSEIIK